MHIKTQLTFMADFESANIFMPFFKMDAKIVPQYTLILLLGN